MTEPIQVFVCGGTGAQPLCETPGCHGKTTALCQYPTPKGKHPTCSRRICDRCAEKVMTKAVCGPHKRFLQERARAAKKVASP